MSLDTILIRLEPTPIKDNGAIARKLIEKVAETFYLVVSDLISPKRDETTALARQTAMYLIRQETDYSLAEVGKLLGNRSPATISWGYQKVAKAIIKSSRLRHKIELIKEILG
jgi:chromosomal replication initiator protein